MKKLGIYIHIPFCIRKCLYCDFLSFENTKREHHKQYIEAVKKELSYYGEVYGNKFTVDTVFFGGGTPSLISGNLIGETLGTIKSRFDMDKNAEISIECNPKTVDKEKLEIYRKAGVNRISIGVQTINDIELKCLGRVHNSEDAKNTFDLARNAGFDNINIDLMFATPNHTMSVWKDTLDTVLGWKPEHISFYSLQLEEGTKYFEMFEKDQLHIVSDETDRQMYHYGVEVMKNAGYHHYEISNGAKPEKECRHNIKYWNMTEYLGIGLGAHSYMEGKRFRNTGSFEAYTSALDQGGDGSSLPWVEWTHENDMKDDVGEFVMTGMRMLEGISFVNFENRFGQKFFEVYKKQKELVEAYVQQGLLIVDDLGMRFTLEGVDISNAFLAEFV